MEYSGISTQRQCKLKQREKKKAAIAKKRAAEKQKREKYLIKRAKAQEMAARVLCIGRQRELLKHRIARWVRSTKRWLKQRRKKVSQIEDLVKDRNPQHATRSRMDAVLKVLLDPGDKTGHKEVCEKVMKERAGVLGMLPEQSHSSVKKQRRARSSLDIPRRPPSTASSHSGSQSSAPSTHHSLTSMGHVSSPGHQRETMLIEAEAAAAAASEKAKKRAAKVAHDQTTSLLEIANRLCMPKAGQKKRATQKQARLASEFLSSSKAT